jgi:K+-sensing histidine kinase KdpD
MAQKRQVRIEYEIAPEVTTIVSDQGKVRQVIFNFIAWAVSRSPVGDSVKINVGLDAHSQLRINLSDNVEHVPEIDHVFDPESSGADDPNINHLGIIIARRLLELLSGSVLVKNRDSQGIDVMMQLPTKPVKGY